MLELLSVPFLIALNAFFVVGEYAVVAVRPAQLAALRRLGYVRSAEAMERLRRRPASAIGAIQVCITMTNLLLGWIGEPAMSALLHRLLGPLNELAPATLSTVATALSFLIVTFLTVVLSELLPKAMTLQYVERAVILTAVPISAIQTVIRPLVWMMNAFASIFTRLLGLGGVDDLEAQRVTIDELRTVTNQAAEEGVLSPYERSIILNSMLLSRRTGRQIMVPRTRVAYLDLQHSMDDNRQIVEQHLHSRLPLCDGGMDNVLGWIHAKEFLSAFHAGGDIKVLSLLAHTAVFAPENISLQQLLVLFHERRTQLAFLVEEHGGVEGIVTLQDVVDELLTAVPPAVAHPPGAQTPAPAGQGPHGDLIVPGEMPLHDLAQRLGHAPWPAPKTVSTVAGLIVAELGRIPAAGEAVDVDGTRFLVVESDGRAVRRIQVMHMPGEGDGGADH